MALGVTLNPASLPDGTLVTYPVLRSLGNPSLTLSGTIDSAQIGAEQVTEAKLAAATRRTVGLGWYNVKDRAYGATGDGVTDDCAAIQAAITAAEADAAAQVAAGAARGAAVVFLPPGDYRLGSFTSGGLNAGGYHLAAGDGTGAPISIHFIGYAARLVADYHQSTGTQYRSYETLRLYPNVVHCHIRGITFRSTNTANIATSGQDFSTQAIVGQYNASFTTADGVLIEGCRFENHSQCFVPRYETAVYGRSWQVRRFHFLDNVIAIDSRDLSNTSLRTADAGISLFEEVVVANNIWDGAAAGTVAGSVTKDACDGFVYLNNPRRCVVVNNVLKNFSYEGIYIIGPTAPPVSAGVQEDATIVIANNVVDGTLPAFANLTERYGIRCDVPNCVVTGNTVNDCSYGIMVVPGSTGDGRRSLVANNQIKLNGTTAAVAGIFIESANVSVKNNTVWVDSYNTGSYSDSPISGIFINGSNCEVRGNSVFANNKNAFGNRLAVGVTVSNASAHTGAIVANNHFRNLNAAFLDVGTAYREMRATDNVIESCDQVLTTTASSSNQFWAGSMWLQRQTLRWTPTATGWHIIANAANSTLLGRLRLGSGRSYGGLADGTMRPFVAEVYATAVRDATGNLQQNALRLMEYFSMNNGPITKVRLTQHGSFNHVQVEVYVDSVASATEINIEWESPVAGAGLIIPVASSGHTERAVLNLTDPGSTYALLGGISFNANGGTFQYATTSDPGSTAPAGATEGSLVQRYTGASSADNGVYTLVDGAWEKLEYQP